MARHQQRRQGFTLIELMITAAILGIIASIAIPNFIRYRYRSQRSEAMSNLKALAKMELAYFGEFGTFTPVGAAMPAGPPTPSKMTWGAPEDAAFATLGFQATGGVYYSYDVAEGGTAACGCPTSTCFTTSAYGDLDGDTGIAVVAYFHPNAAGQTCPTLIGNNPPPLDPSTGNPILSAPAVIRPPGPGSDDF